MNQFKIKHDKPTARSEQETIMVYNRELDEWSLYTDNPTHARKWEKHVAPSEYSASSKTYHQDSGELIAIDGKLDDATISIRPKRKMTESEKAEFVARVHGT